MYLKELNIAARNHHEIYLYEHFVTRKDTLPFAIGRSIALEKAGTTHQLLGGLGSKLNELEAKITALGAKLEQQERVSSGLKVTSSPVAMQRRSSKDSVEPKAYDTLFMGCLWRKDELCE